MNDYIQLFYMKNDKKAFGKKQPQSIAILIHTKN